MLNLVKMCQAALRVVVDPGSQTNTCGCPWLA